MPQKARIGRSQAGMLKTLIDRGGYVPSLSQLRQPRTNDARHRDMIDRMAARGLIRKEKHPGKRVSVGIWITDDGRAAVENRYRHQG